MISIPYLQKNQKIMKNASLKKEIKKVPYSPARVFAISKGEMDKTMREQTEIIRFKPMTSQGGPKKKATILSLIKDKVEEAHKGDYRDLQKIIHRPFLSVRIPGKANPLNVSNFFENRNIEKASPLPLEETHLKHSPLGLSGLLKKSDTISPESPTKKKDMRLARGFNSNFAMAKIERIALKELKFRKEQAKNNGGEGRMHPVEEVDFSPLKGKPKMYFHPLFQNGVDDDDETPLKNRKGGKEKNFFSRAFRKRLIKVLTKMRRLKLTPKDLLKNQKIFSLVPFEKEGSKKFIYAAKTGNFSLVKEYIEKKNRFLVYDFDQVHQTALHWAARNGHTEIVEYLIEKGADVDAKDISGRTPLFFALKNNDILATKFLLGNQADPWSTKDCDYKALSKNNPTVKHYITKAKQLHILMKMTPPALRESLWEKEGLRLIVNMTFNIDGRYSE